MFIDSKYKGEGMSPHKKQLAVSDSKQAVSRFGLLITEWSPGQDDSNSLLESRLGPLPVIIVNQQQLS